MNADIRKKHKRFIDQLKDVFLGGRPTPTMSIHSNRPDTCAVCLKSHTNLGGAFPINQEERWDDLGIIRCRNCGHIAMQGSLNMHNANLLLSEIGFETWENILKGNSTV